MFVVVVVLLLGELLFHSFPLDMKVTKSVKHSRLLATLITLTRKRGGGAPRMPPPSAEAVLSCHKNKDEGVARASSAPTDRSTWGGAVSLMWVCVCWNIVCNKVCEWKTTGSRLHFSYCGKMFLMDLNGVRFVWFGFNYERKFLRNLFCVDL